MGNYKTFFNLGPISRSLVPEAKRIFKRDVDMLCLDTNDLFAGKICAALDRQHPRDFFDLFMYFNQFSYTRELHHAFIVYLLSCKRPISELIKPNFLDIKSTYCQTLEEIRTKIFEIIPSSFTEQEKEFLISFKSGEPKWDLLPIEHAPQIYATAVISMINLESVNKLVTPTTVDVHK